MLAVSDTGTGIAPEHLERVFEPFFTTKETGKGTGLGLAMLYGFVKQSAGHVSIYSEPGEGTTVRLYLPRAPETAPRPAPSQARAQLTGGTETILLVEDDALVRRYAHDQLVALGYRVIESHNGAQALEIIRGDEAIDLLFTDVVMPGLGGRQLVDQARAHRPALKVLYTSGYTENAIVHHGRLDPGVHLLTKPYRREELARRVRAALGS
jgi:CheY-like chemotaxis protein